MLTPNQRTVWSNGETVHMNQEFYEHLLWCENLLWCEKELVACMDSSVVRKFMPQDVQQFYDSRLGEPWVSRDSPGHSMLFHGLEPGLTEISDPELTDNTKLV